MINAKKKRSGGNAVDPGGAVDEARPRRKTGSSIGPVVVYHLARHAQAGPRSSCQEGSKLRNKNTGERIGPKRFRGGVRWDKLRAVCVRWWNGGEIRTDVEESRE